MKINKSTCFICVLLLFFSYSYAETNVESDNKLLQVTDSLQKQLEDSIEELNALRETIANEKIPLNRRLNELESELSDVRSEYQETIRILDTRTLNITNLRNKIKSRQEELSYLSNNLFGQYIRNFESRLHIAELQKYSKQLEDARLAPDNSNLTQQDIYNIQVDVLETTFDRFEGALGGIRFGGNALDDTGLVNIGTFLMIGPMVIFKSIDGSVVGTVEQKIGSLEPSVIAFGSPINSQEASDIISEAGGAFPFDPTQGNAHKIEETKETFQEHVMKGGPVMYPIFLLAGSALLVALLKWIYLAFKRKPSKKSIQELLAAVEKRDKKLIKEKVENVKGPTGEMLSAAVDHIKEPRDLIEEVMYEKLLATRLKLQSFLPFISISAASAPLLGLLGTVTGIINTFKLITVFGSGDVKMLSGGISEALITTECGLIVAIPSLLIHAFLSRKAKGITDEMEKSAVAFTNQLSKTPFKKDKTKEIVKDLTDTPTKEISQDIGDKTAAIINNIEVNTSDKKEYADDIAGSLMHSKVVTIDKNATVAQAVEKIRETDINDSIDTIIIIDDNGKFLGHVKIRQLLSRPEQTRVDTLMDEKSHFVHVDTHKSKVDDLFNQHDVNNIAVVNHDNQLVGLITRNGQS